MGIQEIKKKIVDDALAKARELVFAAEKKKREALEETRLEAEAIRASELAKAREEADKIMRQASSKARLDRLRETAELEKILMDAVIMRAKEKTYSLEKPSLERVMIGAIIDSGARGNERVVLSDRLSKLRTQSFLKTLNSFAKQKGIEGNFSFGENIKSQEDIELLGDGYRVIISIEDILREEGAEMQKEVLKILEGKSKHG